MFKVMLEQCDECLFSPEKIVDNERRREILKTCIRDDRYFICHKATIAGGQQVCCKAFYDQLGERINLIRVARRLRVIQFVSEEALEKANS